MARRRSEEVGERVGDIAPCNYCGAAFKTVGGAVRHKCQKAKLVEDIGDLSLARAYDTFDFWFKYNGFGGKKGKEYQQFLKSPYFKLFVSLDAMSLKVDIGPVKEYVKWLSDNRTPSYDWEKESTIEKYRVESVRSIDAETQTLKSLEAIAVWCDSKGHDISSFFSVISPGEAAQWVHVGKLSPWILIASDKTWDLISRMSDEQVAYFSKMFDIDYWSARAKVAPERAESVKKLVEAAGL